MSVGRVHELFLLAYGYPPAVIASAPGRVNLIGEHVDYNGGAVLPIAIDRRCWVAIGARAHPQSRAVSRNAGATGEWRPGVTKKEGVWWDYVAGALEEAATSGARARPRDVAVVSDVPPGSGLASSAALEVAVLTAAFALDGVSHPSRTVAEAAHRAETTFVGVPCGIMDQFASAMCTGGHALHLACDTREAAQIPFARAVLIADTAAPRALRESAYHIRRSECEGALSVLRAIAPDTPDLAHVSEALLAEASLPPPLDRRARHVVSEVRRVGVFVEALQDGAPVGAFLNESHRSLRDDYECSTPELDWIVDHCVARVGIDGARMTGAGWGGAAIVVGDRVALEEFAPELERSFENAWGRAPHVAVTEASEGARVEEG